MEVAAADQAGREQDAGVVQLRAMSNQLEEAEVLSVATGQQIASTSRGAR